MRPSGPKFSPVCGEHRWDYVYTNCFEEAIYGLIDITFVLMGKNTNSIFEAVFFIALSNFPQEPATESLAGFLLPYPGALHIMKFFELPLLATHSHIHPHGAPFPEGKGGGIGSQAGIGSPWDRLLSSGRRSRRGTRGGAM
jgi:hypothetical protein